MTSSTPETDFFVSDAPLQTASADRFNRWSFSERLAEALGNRSDPQSIVVGLYGAWGEGKTSVLNFAESCLEENEDVTVMKFNPWRFGDETSLLVSFFSQIAAKLGQKLSTKKEDIGKALQKYAFLTAPFSFSPAGVGIKTEKAVESLGSRMAEVDTEELKKRIESFLSEDGSRLVILIDDIDRLDKREIQAVFKLVKLTADFKNTSYILAFDPEMVGAALGEIYGGGNLEAGRQFLEKIVQVPLDLPAVPAKQLRRLCMEGVEQVLKDNQVSISNQEAQLFNRRFVTGIHPWLTTPRMCKRFSNALSFALPILKGEVNLVDLLMIEAVRVFHPEFHRIIRENPDLFPGARDSSMRRSSLKESAQRVLEQCHGTVGEEDKTIIDELLEDFFPGFNALVGGSGYGSEWNRIWTDEQRICSTSYFQRYFSYGIGFNDISDQKIVNFLLSVDEASDEKITTSIEEMASDGLAETFITKLRRKLKNDRQLLPNPMKLAELVAKNGQLFPGQEYVLFNLDVRSQAAILIKELLKFLPSKEERLNKSKLLLQTATPLPFAAECLRWLMPREKRPTPDDFSEEEANELQEIVVSRVRTEAHDTDLLNIHGSGARFLLWTWMQEDPDAVRDYLVEQFSQDPSRVLVFLKAYLPTEWGSDGVVSHGSFMREQYDEIIKIVDPSEILKGLKVMFPDGLDSAQPEDIRFSDLPPRRERRLRIRGHTQLRFRAGKN